MRFNLILLPLIAFMLSLPVLSQEEEVKSVEIIVSSTPIYEELNPKSPVILHAKKGSQFELIGESSVWVKVKTESGKDGWIPATSCKIISSGKNGAKGPFIFALILGISLGFFTFKQAKKKQ